jgi:hypothetical protein
VLPGSPELTVTASASQHSCERARMDVDDAAPAAAFAAAEGDAPPAAELADAGQPGAPAPAEPESGLNGLPLSKNQMKKRAKHEARLAKKAEKKQREKAERGALVAARKAEAAQRLAAMSREEKLAFREECQAKRKARPPAPSVSRSPRQGAAPAASPPCCTPPGTLGMLSLGVAERRSVHCDASVAVTAGVVLQALLLRASPS